MQQQQLRKRQLRRTLNATDPTASVIVPAETMFVFNGSSSDVAQQFYQRYEAGDAAAKLDVPHSKLPERVRARLAVHQLEFDHLHALLQRALLWDSGYIVDDDTTFVPVYTANGAAMADIALSYDDVAGAADCNVRTCASPATTAAHARAYRSRTAACDGVKLTPVLRCAIVTDDADSSTSVVTTASADAAFWATGGDARAIPEMRIVRHTWQFATTQQTFSVSAIHTQAVALESTVDCTDDDVSDDGTTTTSRPRQSSSLIIPCAHITSLSLSNSTVWAAPAPGKLVTGWLEHAAVDKPGASMFRMALVAAGAVVAVVLLLVFCCKCRSRLARRRQRREVAKMTSADPSALLESHCSSSSRSDAKMHSATTPRH